MQNYTTLSDTNSENWNLTDKNVARHGIEPLTRRFSVSCWYVDYVSLLVVN